MVHFAVDDARIKFCTKLDGKKSWFLPFDKGYNDGAGNPPNPDGLMTDYLWKKILTKDMLSRIIENYAQVVIEEDPETKKKSVKQIFPRYHQLDCVEKLLADVKANGVGERYLIQHSAGSGKSNSIAWLAHQLIGLEKDGHPMIDSVLVVTDRRILDKQIRDNIKQFMQVANTVAWAEHSGDLRKAIQDGKRIIITTVEKFPYVVPDIGATHKTNHFAVIIDEAHSGQNGRNSAQMNLALSGLATDMDRLLDSIIDYLNLSDEQFMFFLEQYVNPNIHHWRWNDEEERRDPISNTELVNVVNRYIDHDGYKLVVSDTIGDKNFYKCISTRIGVQGEVKNIIFAAKYKPEIVFDDALNNDIRITKNENQCLIYNRPIPPTGVMWNDLVDWYAEEKNIDENREIVFIKRLCECLDTSFKAQGAKSGPETWMLQAYYNLKKELGKDLPALIPQVYLYYDPQTLKQRGYKLFEHQKMDFLMVFSHKDRVVIEIDGRQHYAEGNSASPRLYSEMVRAQREMTLFGYDVYRFGGYEFVGADSDEKKKEAVLDDLKQFFLRLFSKYSAL